ncbi:MAG TPA: 2Fe-2S iron-sulfur cluster binding domain-containing protein [Aquabacterium sp.]|uniref:NADH:ubiquinone reductase (Na(+)-transporting) subunit F n=1 Tax=Aquabacterium sp. TaxID=1872578 RepID=UPI002E3448F5|nr:2Fe-2S iron-sulfur cluster binding domain-containing protein [Aquabacterium sp.]HEX5372696.1 2Fe-2S iron-sulfur cluster binding domain-containing protein [Aquabacterium sp.]
MFDRLFRRGPTEFNLQINSPGTTVRASTKESLLLAAINQGIAFPYNCRVGGCGECKCKLVQGKVKELTDKSYLLSAEELQQNYILACQSLPRSDVVIEVALRQGAAAHPIIETEGRIQSLRHLTHDILHVVLELQQAMPYTAGQYADLIVPAEADRCVGEGRSFSFASAHDPQRPQRVDFFIRKTHGGAFTEWLFEQAVVGSSLSLQGPYGDFQLRPGLQPLLCIAGGSGLAPIKALLEQAIEDHQGHRHVTLILGARTEKDLYALDEIDQIRRRWTGRFQFIPVLSTEPAHSAWAGQRGLIHEQLHAIVGDRLNEHQAYLCGPPQMIDACIAVMTQAGIDPSQIHFDKFLDSGHMVVPQDE